MPEFTYIARDMQGNRVTGAIDAATAKEAAAQLASRALFPLQVSTEGPAASSGRSRRVGGQLMATTYGQLASLLRSGVPLLHSIEVLEHQTSNAALKHVLADVHTRVEEGATLADAMAQHPRAFREMAVSMVRAGGEGGFLEDALDRVAQFTEQQEDLKSRTMGALAYPVILATVGTIIIVVLLVFFVPRFEEMFDQLRRRGELPAVTDWLLWTSRTINRWGLVLLGALVMLGILIRARLTTDAGLRQWDLLKLRFPLVGTILRSLAVARLCRVLGTLLHNGVPILHALDVSRHAAGNRVLSEAVADASENITAGQSLSGPLSVSGHFPRMVVEMIAVAEQANTLDEVLIDVADGLERRTQRRLDLLVRLIEPIMLLIMAGVVLVVVLALLLPVLKMSTMV